MKNNSSSFPILFSVIFLLGCSSDSTEDSVQEIPEEQIINCDAEININIDNVLSETAEISWTTVGDYNSFEIEYAEEGFTLGQGTKISVTTKTVVLESLPVDSTLDIYIRGKCDSEFGDWSGPNSISTLCERGIFEGDVTLTTQSEVEAFAALCYSGISGFLKIDGQESTEDIIDLSSLERLQEVGGGLIIEYNKELTNLAGLEGLKKVGLIVIQWNPKLISIKGVENIDELTTEGEQVVIESEPFAFFTGITISSNVSLTSLTGLENIKSAGNLLINGNNKLETIGTTLGLESVNSRLSVVWSSLRSLEGLENINEAGLIFVEFNFHLKNLKGLEGLEKAKGISNSPDNRESIYIRNNDSITSLEGLENLSSVRGIVIDDNKRLETIAELENMETSEEIALKNLPSLQNLSGINVSKIEVLLDIDNCDTLVDFEGIKVENQNTAFLRILNCENLTSFTGLNGMTEMEGLQILGNQNLTSLTGMEDVILSRNFINIDNPNLFDYCALTNLIQNGELLGDWVVPNKTLEEMQAGDCN